MNNKQPNASNARQLGEIPNMEQFLTLVFSMREAQKAHEKALRASDPAAPKCRERKEHLQAQVDAVVMMLRAMGDVSQPELF